MQIVFHTNLDLAKDDMNKLSYDHSNKITNDSIRLPRKGDYIEFTFDKWDHDLKRSTIFNYQLQVCSITYNYDRNSIVVELHIPEYHRSMTIAEWEKWFKKHRYNKDY